MEISFEIILNEKKFYKVNYNKNNNDNKKMNIQGILKIIKHLKDIIHKMIYSFSN